MYSHEVHAGARMRNPMRSVQFHCSHSVATVFEGLMQSPVMLTSISGNEPPHVFHND